MLRSDTTNNMSGGIYTSGSILLIVGFRVWPILFWGPLGIMSGVYTGVGAIWAYDTFRRWNWSVRKSLLILAAIPVGIAIVVLLLPMPRID
jgi:hypothetical protein